MYSVLEAIEWEYKQEQNLIYIYKKMHKFHKDSQFLWWMKEIKEIKLLEKLLTKQDYTKEHLKFNNHNGLSENIIL